MVGRGDESQIDTDKITRIIQKVARATGPQDCTEEHRIMALEERSREQNIRLRDTEASIGDGRVTIGVIEEKVSSMKATLEDVNGNLGKLNWILITAVLTAVIAGVIKVIN